jgi:hypothetical protein
MGVLGIPRRRGPFARDNSVLLRKWCLAIRICQLKVAPNIGRPGHRSGTRELPLTPLPT